VKKENFTENISTETLAELIDETLKYEKTQKSNNLKIHLSKLFAAAAVILFVIGLINILPYLNRIKSDVGDNAGEESDRYEEIFVMEAPGINMVADNETETENENENNDDFSEENIIIESTDNLTEQDTGLPDVIPPTEILKAYRLLPADRNMCSKSVVLTNATLILCCNGYQGLQIIYAVPAELITVGTVPNILR